MNNEDLKSAIQDAFAAASPHIIAAGRELAAAGQAFMDALNGADEPEETIEVDISVE